MQASIRTRLLVSLLAVALVSAAGLSAYFLKELEGFALRKLEERLATESRLLAALVAPRTGEDGLGASKGLAAALRDVGPQTASRVRLLDSRGVSLADSGGRAGVAYGSLPEVRQALGGVYGARRRVTSAGRVGLYVATPVLVDGRVAGVAYSSASTFSTLTLLSDYRLRLIAVIALFAAGTLLLTEALSRWLARPLRGLEAGAVDIARGDHSRRVAPEGSRETRALADAFNIMAEEVERVVTELREEERRKSRFVSDVSHELRTPLTAIRGAAETLLEDGVPPDDSRRFLGTIVHESDRLARLANDLLTLERMEGATGELPLRLIDLGALARRALESLAPVVDARDVRVELRGAAPDVLGDPDRLQQVVANLVDNATRMTPPGGTVAVELTEEDGRSTISVLDGGPGLAENDLPHVFERFYRAQPSRDRGTGGAGLGLSIVRAIVTAHGGDVLAVNRPEGGARFTVRLPAAR
ncbi:MAG: ATP-binding protein [Coriobacteriia bacterium]